MPAITFPLSAGLARTARNCIESVRRTFPAHLPLYVCAVLFNAASFGIILFWRLPLQADVSTAFLAKIPPAMAIGLVLLIAWQALSLTWRREKQPLSSALRWVRDCLLKDDRPGNMFHAIVTLTPLMISFDAVKEVIPHIQPFAWDSRLMAWDRFLGFGRLPWQWLQLLLGHPPVTVALSVSYELWFVVMFGCLFWQAFSSRNSEIRLQFLLAFAFCWFFAGNLLALAFSSAGPCYYGHLYPGHDPYAAQMDYLRETAKHWPVWSVHLEDMLWDSYRKGGGVISGISAMPSMHVTIAVLMALLGWRIDRKLGLALTVFAGLIVFGAIHLAWHYAVDVIAGTALAFAFWAAAGLIVRRMLPALRDEMPGEDPATAPRAAW